MDGQTTTILLGCGAGLLAAFIIISVCLLVRCCLKRRKKKPLAECERRLSVRTVKRHPLHPTVGVPVQPTESSAGDAAIFLEEYGRRQGQERQQRDLLRAALSRSMEHLVLEPAGRPSYAPPSCPSRDEGEDSVSPSEVSSVCSDEEIQASRADPVRPRLEFHVVYSSIDSTVTVCLNRLVNVPVTLGGRPCLVRLTALGQQAQSRPFTDAADQPQLLIFRDVKTEWLEQGQLSCHLYVKRFSSLTEKLVGEASVRLSELNLASGTPASCSVTFTRPGTRRTIPLQPSRSPAAGEVGSVAPALGQLLLSLRYRPADDRMTLFLRRGENLPDSRGLVSPEFHVLVMLLKAGDIVTSQESRRVSGRAPVWNQSFYLHIPQPELGIHWIQCIVMVSKIYAKERRVGFCQLGPDTTPSGSQHWEESLRPSKEDSRKWHVLLPVSE